MWITLLEIGDYQVEHAGKPGKSGLLFGLRDPGLCHTKNLYPLFHGWKNKENKGF